MNAVKSWEEYPGAVFDKFNTIASLQEDFEDFNEIAEEFKKSVENSIRMLDPKGEGDLQRGLLSQQYTELSNQLGKMRAESDWREVEVAVFAGTNKIVLGTTRELIIKDQELYDSIQGEMDQIGKEIGLNYTENDQEYNECVANSAPGDEGDC